MPDTWDAIEDVEYIATMVESHFADHCVVASICELLCGKRVVLIPRRAEALELCAIHDSHMRTDGILLDVWSW